MSFNMTLKENISCEVMQFIGFQENIFFFCENRKSLSEILSFWSSIFCKQFSFCKFVVATRETSPRFWDRNSQLLCCMHAINKLCGKPYRLLYFIYYCVKILVHNRVDIGQGKQNGYLIEIVSTERNGMEMKWQVYKF